MSEVISKFIYNDIDKWRTYLGSLKEDNLGVARRGPISEKIEKNLSKFYSLNKSCERSLHPHLRELETKYGLRVKWPKSRKSYKVFLDACKRFERDNRRVKWSNHTLHNDMFPMSNFVNYIQQYNLEFPFQKSSRFDLRLEGLDLSKGSGQPEGGPKRLQLQPAIAYANAILRDPSTPAFYIMPGYRTQMSDPKAEPKTRLVFGVPISEWVLQQMGYRNSIEKTVSYAQSDKPNVLPFYCTPDHALKLVQRNLSETLQVVVFDSTAFDSTVKADELVDSHTWAAEEFQGLSHVVDYILRAPVKLPDGDLNRYGGMPSGCVTTNGIGDGANNLRDIMFCLEAQNLLRYVKFVMVNGDDIAVFFTTPIDSANIDKVSALTSRDINSDKSEVTRDSVFFSKVFYCEKYWCKPMFLVLNSIMFREHEADPLTGTKEYTAVVIAQQCEYLKYHPNGEKIVRLIKEFDKYPIETFDKKELEPALNLYKSKHNWMDETGQMEEVANLPETGFYASVSVKSMVDKLDQAYASWESGPKKKKL